jgi:hypothetical protein
MKAEKRTLIIMSLMAALVLVPMTAFGEEAISGPPPTPLTDPMNAKVPPIEQPLVPEGVFAVQLVEVLKMGHAQDEAQAENMLGTIGIEPKNGWIVGYPVTPVVIGEIKKGVATAADGGKLGMGKDQALKAVENLEANFGLMEVAVLAGVGDLLGAVQEATAKPQLSFCKFFSPNSQRN